MTTAENAAENRAEYVRALGEELAGYERAGNADRAKQVKAEIARAKKAPAGRTAPQGDDA